jgi:hypothetical protein
VKTLLHRLLDPALTIAGPVHETYLVGPRDTAEESAWETEIGWPIARAPSGGETTVGSEQ